MVSNDAGFTDASPVSERPRADAHGRGRQEPVPLTSAAVRSRDCLSGGEEVSTAILARVERVHARDGDDAFTWASDSAFTEACSSLQHLASRDRTIIAATLHFSCRSINQQTWHGTWICSLMAE